MTAEEKLKYMPKANSTSGKYVYKEKELKISVRGS